MDSMKHLRWAALVAAMGVVGLLVHHHLNRVVVPPKTMPAPEPPKDPGPVSVECKPWSSAPSRGHDIEAAEVIKLWKITPSPDNPHPERMDCWDYGRRQDKDCAFLNPADIEARKDCEYSKTHDFIMCDDWADSNAQHYAEMFLWPPAPDDPNVRVPCGGGAECKQPVTADTVHCTVDVHKCVWPFPQVAEVDIDCTTKRYCAWKDPKDMQSCCKVVRRRKVFKPGIELTPEQTRASDQQMADNRIKRYLYCRKWCEDPRYASECASYWNNGSVDLTRKQQGLPPRDQL